MKNAIIILLLCLVFSTGFSQDASVTNPGRATPSFTKERLTTARFIMDIMPGFCRHVTLPYTERTVLDQQLKFIDYSLGYTIRPQENYTKIIDFVFIEVLAKCNGKAFTAQSTSTLLTAEQKRILVDADLGSDVSIKIKFNYKNQLNNTVDGTPKINEGKYIVTVVPETEAEFPAAFKSVEVYLTEHVTTKISDKSVSRKIEQAIVKFTVDEAGKVVDAKISRTSADPKIDNLLLEATNKMPAWKPAENSKGIKVKQEFNIPLGGGC